MALLMRMVAHRRKGRQHQWQVYVIFQFDDTSLQLDGTASVRRLAVH